MRGGYCKERQKRYEREVLQGEAQEVWAALKSSWNLAGVEPGDQEGPGC